MDTYHLAEAKQNPTGGIHHHLMTQIIPIDNYENKTSRTQSDVMRHSVELVTIQKAEDGKVHQDFRC